MWRMLWNMWFSMVWNDILLIVCPSPILSRGWDRDVSTAYCWPSSDGDCPILDSECPIFDGECSILDGECSILYGECPILYAECPILDGECPILGSDWCPILDGECPILGGGFAILDEKHAFLQKSRLFQRRIVKKTTKTEKRCFNYII